MVQHAKLPEAEVLIHAHALPDILALTVKHVIIFQIFFSIYFIYLNKNIFKLMPALTTHVLMAHHAKLPDLPLFVYVQLDLLDLHAKL